MSPCGPEPPTHRSRLRVRSRLACYARRAPLWGRETNGSFKSASQRARVGREPSPVRWASPNQSRARLEQQVEERGTCPLPPASAIERGHVSCPRWGLTPSAPLVLGPLGLERVAAPAPLGQSSPESPRSACCPFPDVSSEPHVGPAPDKARAASCPRAARQATCPPFPGPAQRLSRPECFSTWSKPAILGLARGPSHSDAVACMCSAPRSVACHPDPRRPRNSCIYFQRPVQSSALLKLSSKTWILLRI